MMRMHLNHPKGLKHQMQVTTKGCGLTMNWGVRTTLLMKPMPNLTKSSPKLSWGMMQQLPLLQR